MRTDNTAHIKHGQQILIHAGAGGLGSTVIHLAKHLGAHVATTVSGAKAELVRDLGADVVIDYSELVPPAPRSL